MDGTTASVVVGVVAVIVAIIVPILLYVLSQRTTEKAAVRAFMSALKNVHLLFETPNDHPDDHDIVHTMMRLDEIRDRVSTLLAVVHDAKDTAALDGIRDSSYEMQAALRGYNTQPPEHRIGFADVLNRFRQQVKPLVDGICDRHEIPEHDRPRIEPHLAGESDKGETQHA